jgi:hypothetical protein
MSGAATLWKFARRARHALAARLGLLHLWPRIPVPEAPGPTVDFRCNVCARRNSRIARAAAENRECPSCRYCGSSLRMRSLMHLLSLELHGAPLTLPDFPRRASVVGLGMSDWPGYAWLLAHKMRYRNTFYHAEPHLDITAPPPGLLGKQRFLISSDVFEHIPPLDLKRLMAQLHHQLAEGGIIITQPMVFTGISGGHDLEWYPRSVATNPSETAWGHLLDPDFRTNTYVNKMTRRAMRTTFEEAGFEVTRDDAAEPDFGRHHLTPERRAALAQWDDYELFSNNVTFHLRRAH